MPESDVREALGGLELFEGAPPAILERLAMVAHPFSLAAGEYLFREGDPGDRISLLASGSMEAIMRLPGGRELEIEPLGPGGLIGEMAMLAARPRRFSVRASEASTGWSFAAADIGRLGATEQPEVVRRLGRLALERLREQYTRLAVLCGEDPRAEGSSRSAELDDAGPVVAVDGEPEETAYLETVLFFSRFSAPEIEELFGDLRRLEAPRGASVVADLRAGAGPADRPQRGGGNIHPPRGARGPHAARRAGPNRRPPEPSRRGIRRPDRLARPRALDPAGGPARSRRRHHRPRR